MSSIITRPFTTPSNYTYDSDKVEVTGGYAQLKLTDLPNQDFVQNFTNDTGFTYDNTKAEFVGGKVQQKDVTPTDSTFYADYISSINGTWGDGVLTGTGTGSPVITLEQLDLTDPSNQYVSYDADLNADSQQVGCMRVDYYPDYSVSPSATQYIMGAFKNHNQSENSMQVYQLANGNVTIQAKDQADGSIFQANLGVWSPTAGTKYVFELNWDLTAGATRLFINGTQFGATRTQTGIRSTAIALFRIGQHVNGTSGQSDFLANNFMYFSTVQHTGNHTPVDYNIPYRYVASTVTLPEVEYTGPGALQEITAFVTTETGTPRYILQVGRSGDYLYWNGSAWIVSDETFVQSNTKTDFNANAGLIDIEGEVYGQYKLNFEDSTTQSSVDVSTTTVTGQAYPTDNPTIYFNETTNASELTEFVSTEVATGSDLIKWVITIDGVDKYWNGAAVATSDGYSKSNTAADINTNIAEFLSDRSAFRMKAFLHSDDGTTFPKIDVYSVTYDASLPDVTQTLIDVNGFIYTNNAALNSDPIKFRPYLSGFVNEGIFYEYEYDTIGSTDTDGYFSGNVGKNPVGTFWEVKIGKQSYIVTLENITATNVDFADLSPVLVEN